MRTYLCDIGAHGTDRRRTVAVDGWSGMFTGTCAGTVYEMSTGTSGDCDCPCHASKRAPVGPVADRLADVMFGLGLAPAVSTADVIDAAVGNFAATGDADDRRYRAWRTVRWYRSIPSGMLTPAAGEEFDRAADYLASIGEPLSDFSD